MLTFSARLRNRLDRPLQLGFVQGSGLMIDDKGVRYTLAGGAAARWGIGLVSQSRFDPQFVLQAGESGDLTAVSPGAGGAQAASSGETVSQAAGKLIDGLFKKKK